MLRRVLLLIVLAACGAGSETDKYMGAWSLASDSSATRECEDVTRNGTRSISGTFTVDSGTTADFVASPFPWDAIDGTATNEPPCDLRFDLNAGVATARPNQSCSFQTYIRCSPTCITGMWNLAYNSLTLESAENDTLTIQGTGTWTYRVDNGIPATCTEMLTASAVR